MQPAFQPVVTNGLHCVYQHQPVVQPVGQRVVSCKHRLCKTSRALRPEWRFRWPSHSRTDTTPEWCTKSWQWSSWTRKHLGYVGISCILTNINKSLTFGANLNHFLAKTCVALLSSGPILKCRSHIRRAARCCAALAKHQKRFTSAAQQRAAYV